jgi:DNA repair exonuclease SbcCD nuclease subunit
VSKKALVISDLHLRPALYDVAVQVLQKAEACVKETKPDYLIVGGDTFHTKNTIYASMISLFEGFLKRVTKQCEVIVLVGNHDWGIPYAVHALQTMRMPNLTIVDSHYKLNDHVGFVSFFREEERLESELAMLKGCSIIFGHFDINGFEYGSGVEVTESFCTADRFAEYKKVFSGHFHKPQEKTLANGAEIIYVGSSYTIDFGESDQAKRFLLVDLETGEWSAIPTNLTLHKTIRITALDQVPDVDVAEINSGVSVRVVVSGTKEEIAKFKVPSGYKAKVIFDFKSSDGTRLDINASDDQDEMMVKYVDFEIKRVYGGDKAGFDKEKLMRTGRAILARVKGKS